MKDLVDACRSLELDQGTASSDLESLVHQEFPAHFGIPVEEHGMSRTTGEPVPKPVKELIDELVQHLVDLGYLLRDFYIDYHQIAKTSIPIGFSQKISAAIKTYFVEDLALKEAGLSLDNIDWEDLLETDEMLSIVVQRLNLLTSLDGEFTIDSPLKLNEKSLFSRVLNYRLNSLGLLIWTGDVSAPISRQTIIQSLMIHVLLAKKKREEIDFAVNEIDPGTFALSGDAHMMFRDFAKRHGKKMLVYQCKNTTAKAEANYELLLVFKQGFIDGKNERAFKRKLRRKGLDPDSALTVVAQRTKLNQVLAERSNRFGTRLLQLKLWMFGFYYGEIDGDFADLSHEALLEFFEQEDIKKQKKYLLALKDKFWAVNLPQIASRFKNYDEKIADAEAQENELIENIPEDSEEQILQADMDNKSSGLREFRSLGLKKQRRIYHGIKSIVASAAKGLKRIKKWLKTKLEKIAGAVYSFFKNITKRIREGILIFYRALRRFSFFVLRKPVVNPERFWELPPDSPFVITRFDLDSDVVIFQSKGLSPVILSQHRRLVRKLSFGLALFLDIAGVVISLIASLRPPFGWIRLGVRIGQLIAKVLKLKIKLPRVPGVKLLAV